MSSNKEIPELKRVIELVNNVLINNIEEWDDNEFRKIVESRKNLEDIYVFRKKTRKLEAKDVIK